MCYSTATALRELAVLLAVWKIERTGSIAGKIDNDSIEKTGSIAGKIEKTGSIAGNIERELAVLLRILRENWQYCWKRDSNELLLQKPTIKRVPGDERARGYLQ
jgi:hypothetical protein